jgi:hypothetical protein
MKRLTMIALCAILTMSTGFAQQPPRGLSADLDEMSGQVHLNWFAPPDYADYFEDFSDGEAQDFVYKDAENWRIEDNWLVARRLHHFLMTCGRPATTRGKCLQME